MIFGKRINKYYLRYLHIIIFGVIALIVVDYFQLKIPELYRIMVNALNEGVYFNGVEDVPFTMDVLLDKICLPLIFIILALVAGRFLWRVCFFGTAIEVESSLRREMFANAKHLSQQYYSVNKVGNMMALFTNDLETINECFGDGLLMTFDALILGGMAIFKMYNMSWLLTILCLVPMVIMLFVGLLISFYMTKKWEERQEAFSALSDFSQESFSGIAVIKAFVKQGLELLAFKKLNKKNEDVNVQYTRLSTLTHVGVTLFVESVIAIILGYGGYLVYTDVFDGGQLIEFIGYFTSITWPIMAISMLIEMRSRGKASLKRVNELIEAQPDIKDDENAIDCGIVRGKIQFKGLNFTYPLSTTQVLFDVSFLIDVGESVGIIGRTGTGKTTIVDLILRTYNVPDGTIFIDDKDINSLTVKSLRRNVSYVPQDNFLFSDTIKNNIAFALDEIVEGQVENAASLADVHNNVKEFKYGYDTILGERGVTVSCGQKQRISIARALLKDAPILILDDSVSAVDTATEKIIIDNLKSTRKGKTTILIAHRISTVKRMDKIILVDGGRVIAVGSHEELFNSCHEYAELVDLQKLEGEDL